LGLSIFENSEKRSQVSEKAYAMAAERVKLRKEGRYRLADEMRVQIEKMGYEIKDDANGKTKLIKKI
jgi:cysteinyl-tRNA synthetase